MLTFNSATIHAISQVFHRYAPADNGDPIPLNPEDIWDAMHTHAEECVAAVGGTWEFHARGWASHRAFIVDVFQVARALIEAVEASQ